MFIFSVFQWPRFIHGECQDLLRELLANDLNTKGIINPANTLRAVDVAE